MPQRLHWKRVVRFSLRLELPHAGKEGSGVPSKCFVITPPAHARRGLPKDTQMCAYW